MSQAILRQTENACAALAYSASVSASLGLTFGNGIYTGLDNEDKDAPAVVCFAESATEDFPFSGMYRVKTHILIKEMAADTSMSSSLATTMFEAFCNSGTKGVLNQYSGYFVYEYFIDGTHDLTNGDANIQQYDFEIVSALK